MNTNWMFKGTEIVSVPHGTIGFVYLITNLKNGKLYIGKKKFHNVKSVLKTVVLKSGEKKKKKQKVVSESDWQEYYGSNTELQNDVNKHGVQFFERKILYLCTTLGEMSYLETFEIFTNHAIIRDNYYNTWCSVRVRTNHLPKGYWNEKYRSE